MDPVAILDACRRHEACYHLQRRRTALLEELAEVDRQLAENAPREGDNDLRQMRVFIGGLEVFP